MGLELHIYDFDGTLFRSPETPEGWDNRWWISSESLNPPCVPIDPSGEWWISKTVSAARASIANPDTYAVMITGRPVKSSFRYRVPELLKSAGLRFDEVYLSDSNNTPAFKIKVINKLLSKFPGVDKVVFWDDNAPYLKRYTKLVEGLGYQVEANLVTVPAMECEEVPPMPEFKKQASEQVEVMKFLSAVARNAGVSKHVYVVGGAVRNFIIGQPIKDVDVVIDSVALRGKDSAWFARKIADSLPCESSLVTNNYGVAILTIKGPWVLNGYDLSGEVIEIANARKESYGGDDGKGYKPNMVEPATIQEDVVRREFTFNCMAGDTLIPTERGILRIDEIASREDGVQQNINLKVAGQDGPATAVGWQYSGFAPTLRVTTEWGHSFACTHHHPVLVLRGCRHEWVQADQLGEGDLLCVPVRQVVRQTPLALELPDPVQPKRGALKEVTKPAVMTPELAFVIGCVVAEGSNTHKRVSFSNSDPALISRYVECFQAVFGFQPSRNKVVEKGSVRILRGVEFVANKDGYDIYADSKAVVGWLEDLGLYCGGSKNDRSASHYKVVPWSILQADEQSQSAFLAAYLEGDGSIRPDSGRMVFRSVSPHIRQQLQVLLGAHGVLGKVEGEFVYVNAVDAAVLWSKIHPWMVTKTFDYTSRKFKSRNRYGIPADYIKGFVAGRKQDANQSVYVTDGGASRTLFGVYEPVRKIQRLLHDAHARGDFDGFMASLKVISPDEHANLQRLFDLGYQYVGVTSVEDAGEQDVFDISMNEGVEPAFVANGVVVHNTLLWRLHDLADGPDKAEIIDLSGCGLRDLQSGTMRCPNDPDIVFSDDPSRMVRAIKFLLKYGFRIDAEVAASIKRNAQKLKQMPAAHLSTMLVETFFEPGVGKKALLEMGKLGLLDVVREIAEENKPFKAALDNWANRRSELKFLFDLLDLQMPMGKRLSVVPQDLLPQFRAYSEAEPDKAVALLEVLDQPGRKFDMPRLIRELGISGAEIKNVTNTIRRLLVLDPDLTESDLYRKLLKTAAVPDKYSHIDFKPPKSVADAAAKGLEYRQKASPSNKGGLTPAEASKQGIGSGVQRAVNLKNRDNTSPDVIRQMVAFFSRHEKNKSIAPENKDTPWNDKGHVAWLIWGGDPGKAWAEKVRNQMDKADEGQKPSARRVASRFVGAAWWDDRAPRKKPLLVLENNEDGFEVHITEHEGKYHVVLFDTDAQEYLPIRIHTDLQRAEAEAKRIIRGEAAGHFRFASEDIEPPQIFRTPHPATLILRGVAELNQIAPMINRVLPRISLEPASIPKPKEPGKAYHFHWSNAQEAWDVIPVREYPASTDGSEFVLFIPKGVMNPVYEAPWSLRDMQVVARKLSPHPAFSNSLEFSRRRF